jgi:hypothetical protein
MCAGRPGALHRRAIPGAPHEQGEGDAMNTLTAPDCGVAEQAERARRAAAAFECV